MALSATAALQPQSNGHGQDEHDSDEFIIYSSHDENEEEEEESTTPHQQQVQSVHHEEHDDDKKEENENMKNHFVNIEELHSALVVPLSSRRRIRITKSEQRVIQKTFSLTKYTVYTLCCSPPMMDGVALSVCRRFNDFKWLRLQFLECFPSIYIPPIPRSKVLGRFAAKFLEQRKKDLERFLNRICGIKPLAESLVFTIFLSQPEETLAVSKQEISRNHSTNNRQKALCLQRLFPALSVHDEVVREYIDYNVYDIDLYHDEWHKNEVIAKYKESADRIIFGSEIKEIHAFLERVCSRMSSLCEAAERLDEKLPFLRNHSKKFHESFWKFHESDDVDGRSFYGWFRFNKAVHATNHELLSLSLKYELQDMAAFVELFEARNRFLSKLKSIISRNESWRKLIEAEYQMQPHQVAQVQGDYEEEKELRSLLLMMTKVLTQYNVNAVWKRLIGDWHAMIRRYAQRQLLCHQVLYAEAYQDVEDGADDEQEEEEEEYEYEPVFDEHFELKLMDAVG